MGLKWLCIYLMLFSQCVIVNITCLDLPPEHLPYYKKDSGYCWGYEPGCSKDKSFSQQIQCQTENEPSSRRPSKDVFFDEADFGYVKQRIDSLTVICEPKESKDSSLVCSKHLQFCSGRGIMMDFSDLPARKSELLRYSMDVLKEGQIGGHCRLDKERIESNSQFMAPLQSWAPELGYFVELNDTVVKNSEMCQVYIDRPTFIMKIDASVNYYHHFCDFFNLYASLHINSTHPDMFSREVNILIWENRQYVSNFDAGFRAFTNYPIMDLTTLEGKRVCFKNVVFPLLPRMIYGLYYNTPLFSNCKNSGLFEAFSQFIPYRLGISSPSYTNSEKLRVTVIKRLTKFRRILNLGTIVDALEKTGRYEVTIASFSHNVNFVEQLRIIRNTDILVGIHGAGLTHMLFLPDWASVFELYDCEDSGCYSELARLRGVEYVTWTQKDLLYPEDEGQHPSDPSKGHAKFTNYSFDPDEFVRIVERAGDYVRKNSKFQKLDKAKQSKPNNKDEL